MILTESYDKDNIEPARLKKLHERCMTNENWKDGIMEKSNVANNLMYKWVNAMVEYNKEFVASQPLRDKLAATEARLAQATSITAKKVAELNEITQQLDQLQQRFVQKENEREELGRKINESRLKLERASKLTSLLADEKKRWAEEIINLESNLKLVPHDSLISAGMVAYSGPFVSNYRIELEQSWVKELQTKNLVHTPKTRMTKFLGDPVKILSWNLNGLPKDDSSIENGIIIANSRRWPLMIDPQNQANKYIKNMGMETNERFEPIKASNSNLMRTIEQKIQHGEWALVENVGINLDPALEPILQQKVITMGGSKSI